MDWQVEFIRFQEDVPELEPGVPLAAEVMDIFTVYKPTLVDMLEHLLTYFRNHFNLE